jgi:GT2 family glycosyltransferase
MSPTISVIIPTFQRNALLAKCLDCLAPGMQLGFTIYTSHFDSTCSGQPTYEVIVTDDGRDSTAELMILQMYPWAHWIQGPRRGPGANRNSGVDLAMGQWLAFTDDDCLPQPGWLQAFMISIAAHPGTRVFEGMTIPDRPRKTLAEHSPVGSQPGNLWSCNFLILRDQYLLMGGFDEQFRVCMEDKDLALRVRQSGLHYPFVENALVIHPWRLRTLVRDGWKTNKAEVLDHVRFKTKHPNAISMSSFRLLKLALRVLWCDICFILENRDLFGIPFACADFIRVSSLAMRLVF